MYKCTDTTFFVLISCSSKALVPNFQHVRRLVPHDVGDVWLYTGYGEGHDSSDKEAHSFYIVGF
jgi:hypothetical protein